MHIGGKPSHSDPLLEVSTYNNETNSYSFVEIVSVYKSYNYFQSIILSFIQTVDIRQISDKFPEKSGGLKELYEKGPQNAFYLVKCWADLNTNIIDEAGAFYGVTSQWVETFSVFILVQSTCG